MLRIPNDSDAAPDNILAYDTNDNPIAVSGSDAVHKVVYFGDTDGMGSLQSSDASLMARVGLKIDDGFSADPLTAPSIIGDVTGDGLINGNDASLLSQKILKTAVDGAITVPNGGSTSPGLVGNTHKASSLAQPMAGSARSISPSFGSISRTFEHVLALSMEQATSVQNNVGVDVDSLVAARRPGRCPETRLGLGCSPGWNLRPWRQLGLVNLSPANYC